MRYSMQPRIPVLVLLLLPIFGFLPVVIADELLEAQALPQLQAFVAGHDACASLSCKLIVYARTDDSRVCTELGIPTEGDLRLTAEYQLARRSGKRYRYRQTHYDIIEGTLVRNEVEIAYDGTMARIASALTGTAKRDMSKLASTSPLRRCAPLPKGHLR